jgi:hypothetical protein
MGECLLVIVLEVLVEWKVTPALHLLDAQAEGGTAHGQLLTQVHGDYRTFSD